MANKRKLTRAKLGALRGRTQAHKLTPAQQQAMVTEVGTRMAELWLSGFVNDVMIILKEEFEFDEAQLTKFAKALRMKKREP